MKVDPRLLIRFPLIFNVPPETVKVPLFVKVLLFKVQPTVTSPEETVKVPPEAILIPLDTLALELTVTLVPAAMVTKSVQVGNVPLFHVVVAFQSPFAIETKGISAAAIPIYKGPAKRSVCVTKVLCAPGVAEPFWCVPLIAAAAPITLALPFNGYNVIGAIKATLYDVAETAVPSLLTIQLPSYLSVIV